MKVGVNALFMIPGEVGGSEIFMREAVRAIAQYFSEVKLEIFTNEENDSFLNEEFGNFRQVSFTKIKVHARSRIRRIFREQFELPERVKETGVDLLWSPGYKTPFFSPCPQMALIADLQYKHFPEDLSMMRRLSAHAFMKMAAARSKYITTISEFSKSEIVKYLAVSPERVFVIHSGVTEDFAKPVEGRLPLTQPYLLCVANSYPHKNIPCLIDAFWELLNSIPHRLVLIGKPGRGESALQGALKKIPADRILRIPYCEKSDLIDWYQHADAFVFPSLYEGFGLPVVEAMMAGTPVITTACAAIPEVAGEAAVYFNETSSADLADQIKDVLSWNGEKRRRVIAKARERATHFSWKKSAEKLVNCFEFSCLKIKPESQ